EFHLQPLRMRIEEPAKVFFRPGAREIVENEHALALVQQTMREIDADKAGAARDNDRRARLGAAFFDRLRLERVADGVEAAVGPHAREQFRLAVAAMKS